MPEPYTPGNLLAAGWVFDGGYKQKSDPKDPLKEV
jgi:hypothetical protein